MMHKCSVLYSKIQNIFSLPFVNQ